MATFTRRHLPHLYAIGVPIFLTWRLQGSLPQGRQFPETLKSGKAFVAMDQLLDSARTGPTHLRNPEIAQMTVAAIGHLANADAYDLHNFVVMPNHVHLLITPRIPVPKITQSLKRFTAQEANRILSLTGKLWQPESYDRLVRSHTEFRRIANYIEMNPVKAGLAIEPEDYPWSSAGPIENRPQVENLPHRKAATP